MGQKSSRGFSSSVSPLRINFQIVCAALVFAAHPGTSQAALDLRAVEQAALQADPAVAVQTARARALSENSVADGQLPDPKLKLGMFNLPLDSLDVDKQPTTQLRFGLQQAFPRGDTLKYRQKGTVWSAAAQQARAADSQRSLLRDVRATFLDLYYQVWAGTIIAETRDLFAQLVEITQAHYGSGRVSQQDVLRAQLELSRLDDRATRIRNREDVDRATLAKWIGRTALQSLNPVFPTLPEIPSEDTLEAGLQRHPAIVTESARIQASRQSVQVAREQYKPGWNVGVEYRKRYGRNPDDTFRSDMMAAMVTMDLPLFYDKRQDRRLAASLQQADAARYSRDDRLRTLREMMRREYANWRRLGDRQTLYQDRLVREARANATASLNAYQSGVTEFTTLMRARITELNVRLDDLRIRVDRAIAQARLLYLASGENS